ncbi:MAG: penicillin-binding protein 2, partial [Cellulomonas sp.]|nr:penicillin-binding protein 2 [Cellulomonas sp.]
EVIDEASPQELGTPISAATAAALRDMMLGVVENGTGSSAKFCGVQVAGKTGTAQTSADAAPHAWFTAFAPADAPRVAVAVVVENGGSVGNEATGGKVAAPIARAVIEAVLAR